MTVDDIRTLFAFNRWANDEILAACRSLEHEDFARDLRTSYRSIRGTLVHTLWAEWIWFRRLLGESPKVMFTEEEFPAMDAIESRWHELDDERRRFIDSLTDDRLPVVFEYENLKGEHWKYSYQHAMQHVVNHSSYHRGQIVTLLRQLGKTPPSTDFLMYFDEGPGSTAE